MAQSNRMASGGALIDRARPVTFRFDGKSYIGFEGDTLASALLANGVKLLNRSYKYHRPRGVVTSGPEEPNALVNLGEGPTHEPNIRATQVELREGLSATSQNRYPSLDTDVGVLNNLGAKLFPAGFYYKTFLYPRAAWKHVYEPIIRRIAGLGRAPTEADNSEYEHFYFHSDIIVAGGGAAGLSAARVAAEAGAKVLLVEQSGRWGGRVVTDEEEPIDGLAPADWVAAQVAALEAMPNVTMRLNACCSASYDHGYALVYERCGDKGEASGPRHRLWRVRTKRIVAASGMIERPIAFHYNDVPGVMLAGAVRDYVRLWGVAPGNRTVIYTTNDDGYRTARALTMVGKTVAAIIDSRPDPRGPLVEQARRDGLRVIPGSGVAAVKGGKRGVSGVQVTSLRASGRAGGALEHIDCDCVAMAGGWSPVVHLYSHSGGKVLWDDALAMYRPDPLNPPLNENGARMVLVAGGADGALTTAEVLRSAVEAGAGAASDCGFDADEAQAPACNSAHEEAIKPVWFTPGFGKASHGSKHFLDFQNDVTAADVELAAREGFESVEHAKRYTTLGMATDQGKLSNINGHAILADALGKSMPAVGTTTFRPPYTPISFGSIAGRERGDLFKVVRRTAAADWHDANGADWEPVGDWRRVYRYQQGDEDRHASVNREIINARTRVGLLDASTLGKIIVKGPDAGWLLDMMYTNMMSSLKPGRCRYGLMCDDNGFLFDDGVVARLDEETFLCHTTSGGADRVHGWLEEWLQTEWFDKQVYTANVTEQWSQFAVAGPKSRALLQSLGTDMDLSAEALPFMSFKDGHIGDCPVRAFRISFSGELSYEIATPAAYGKAFWDKLIQEGAALGAAPYGTEALHVMRAEKGFIMIGDETDGTVTPYDLNMSWAVSKKKTDFLGKRAMQRDDFKREDRKQLVGLLTDDPNEVLPDGAHAVAEVKPKPPMQMIGHVTSSYWSPTLGRSIAMALIKGGAGRLGETLSFPMQGGKVITAKVVDPVFFDKEGARQNV